MAINFDNALGIHEAAVRLRARKGAVITNNLVNADTPGYLAKDIDFKEVLKQELSNKQAKTLIHVDGTNKAHIGQSSPVTNPDLKYRVPFQPSQDGNTVDSSIEYVKYAENALRYEASLQFLSSKLNGIMTALKGDSR